MSEQCPDILRCDPQNLRQAMSIHTRKITDACRDKDCVEDLRVYLTAGSQQTLDNAANVRVRSAELLHTYIDVEPVAFDRNHYCIDITFYYRILADAVVGTCRPAALSGLAVFSKRAVLCGEDSRAHIFTSDTRIGEADGCTLSSSSRPTAVVEVLDPMVLSSKVKDACECGTAESVTVQIPAGIRALFDEELTIPATIAACTSRWDSSPSSGWNGMCSWSCRWWNTPSQKRNAATARAAAPKTPAKCSAAFPSPPASSLPPAATGRKKLPAIGINNAAPKGFWPLGANSVI